MKLTKRNKVVIPVVLLLGIIIGGAVVLRSKGLLAALLDAGKKITYNCQEDANADCDTDGLKNWQEELYHTNSNNPDTDGDGYLDGEEIASGYDPTIKSPNDALPGTNTQQTRTPPKNLTLYLAQILSEKISSGEFAPSSSSFSTVDDQNSPYNQQTLEDALAQIGERARTYFVAPIIQDSEIKVSSQPTTYAEIGAYITQMGQAAKPSDAVSQLQKSEIILIQDAVASKDYSEIKMLIASNKQTIADMRNITAPADFVEIHKRQISLLELDQKILEAVQDMEIDPATATAGLEAYSRMIDAMKAFSDDLYTKIESYQK